MTGDRTRDPQPRDADPGLATGNPLNAGGQDWARAQEIARRGEDPPTGEDAPQEPDDSNAEDDPAPG